MRPSRGGGQQANLNLKGLKAKRIHWAIDINHSSLKGDLPVDRFLLAAASIASGPYLQKYIPYSYIW